MSGEKIVAKNIRKISLHDLPKNNSKRLAKNKLQGIAKK